MKYKMQRAIRITSAGALFLCLLAPLRVSAASQDQQSTDSSMTATTSNTTSTPDSYNFTAKKGDSLTRLVRKALQLYEINKKIVLEPAAAVYGETVTTQALGGQYLEIGQHVSIPTSLLQSAVDGSKTLTAKQLAAWAVYADNVTFDVSDVVEDSTASQATSTKTTENTSPDIAATPEAGTKESDQKDTTKDAGTYWWFVGAGALIVIYFVLGGPSPRIRKP